MRLIELECKKCKYSFTRLVKEKKEIANDRCQKCGGGVKTINDIKLKESGGCASCSGCNIKCGIKTKNKT